jgi:mercuric ion transport protein
MSEIMQDTGAPDTSAKPAAGVLFGFGLVAALAALVGASCCALPLVLASLGLAGAWTANLEVFVVYRPYVTVVALLVIGVGWLVALRRGPSRHVLLVLGCASVLVLGAIAVAAYEPQITRYLISLRGK